MEYKYYCELNASCFKQNALTISEENINCFIPKNIQKTFDSKKIAILFNKNEYIVTIRYIKRDKNKGGSYYQLRWNKDFNEALSKEFIYSYINFMEENNKNNEQQEVMVFKRKPNEKYISLVPVNKVKTQFDNIFRKLFDINYFGLNDDDKTTNEHIIIYNSPWYDKTQLSKYSNEANVIYYLVDENNKQLYIGSTKKIGSRFSTERNEIPKWNKFRYDRINPKYNFILRCIEHHTINAFMFFMKNTVKHSKHNNFNFWGDYTLVNKSQYN
jgi:hypothetical protein